MKILLVEDNETLAERIKHKLVEQRYVVDVVQNGEDALELVKTITYTLIILDLGLPTITGDVVCKKMRENGITTPILILTGTGGVKNKVKLLDSGADDYLTKPFNSKELRARVSALTRRQPPVSQPTSQIKFGNLTIDTAARLVYHNDTPIILRRKEFDILTYLLDNSGRIVTRKMIAQHVWDTNQEGDTNAIDVHITHLRNKIDRPFETSIIKTVYGLGYRVDILRDEEKERTHQTK